MNPSIGALNIYPVKSCRGIAVPRAALTERGLAHDREWMIVEAPGDPARFVTQREIPRLALLETRVAGALLTLWAPGMPLLDIRLDETTPQATRRSVVVWRDTLDALDQGDAAANWLSSFAATQLRLVRFDPGSRRFCNREYAGDTGAHTGFADGYPLLVLGTESLRDLNLRLAEHGSPALPMNRFRPNLVIEGLDAYDEDHLASVTIGDAQLRFVKPCVRCQITTTDQATAQVGHEPMRTLAGYRNNPRLGGVTFGMNAIVHRGAGTVLEVGAPVSADWAF